MDHSCVMHFSFVKNADMFNFLGMSLTFLNTMHLNVPFWRPVSKVSQVAMLQCKRKSFCFVMSHRGSLYVSDSNLVAQTVLFNRSHTVGLLPLSVTQTVLFNRSHTVGLLPLSVTQTVLFNFSHTVGLLPLSVTQTVLFNCSHTVSSVATLSDTNCSLQPLSHCRSVATLSDTNCSLQPLSHRRSVGLSHKLFSSVLFNHSHTVCCHSQWHKLFSSTTLTL